MVVSIEKGMYPSIDPKMPESFRPNGQGLGILLFGASLDEKDVPPVPAICQKVGHSKQVGHDGVHQPVWACLQKRLHPDRFKRFSWNLKGDSDKRVPDQGYLSAQNQHGGP